MGLKGRKRRGRHFEERAEAFANALAEGRGYREAARDKKTVIIGTGQHKRLIAKRHHLSGALEAQGKLHSYLKEKGITPERYSLVMVKGIEVGGIPVQEYFNKPTLAELAIFLSPIEKGTGLSGDTLQLCRKFAGQHKTVNFRQLVDAYGEMRGHLQDGKTYYAHQQNLVVLGLTKDGKVRLAIIDV